MSTDTQAQPAPSVESEWLKVGVVAGAIFGIVSGALFWASGDMPEIGALIGMPTVLGGWLFHLVMVFVIMIVFAAALSTPSLSQYASELRMLILIGLAYGVLIWIALDAFVLSYLAVSVGIPGAIFPGFALETLVEDLVIGFLVALFYYGTRRWVVTTQLVGQKSTSP
ncbi:MULTISPECIES: hypothetical protein [Haloferax]|uniref:Uncharacterized protein n=2 Tax=Haloferax TaxID=2251 RepID=A0A6G1Z551_9EURY|nr:MULTISPECIES: hypothetical protein [Haloferax]KAB1188877.1 hypothetical protein Hfx1149_12855 [Haloferax sp. CBA1149]MRW81595.1 hypothetical protein [Haloferax marinisediminis]